MRPEHEHRQAEWTTRPRFWKDEPLTAERLNRLHDHHAERLRRATLAIAGTGVVHGYALDHESASPCEAPAHALHVGCGLAFDHRGRQLDWRGGWITTEDLVGELAERGVVASAAASEDHDKDYKRQSDGDDEKSGREPEPEPNPEADGSGCVTLVAHYAEERATHVNRCGCEGADWVRERVVFSIRPDCPKLTPRCPDHVKDCIDAPQYRCERLGGVTERSKIGKQPDLNALCDEPRELCPVGRCDLWYDPVGVPIACVRIGACPPRTGDEHNTSSVVFLPGCRDTCAARRWVYRNPLLRELIDRCDTTYAHVRSISLPWLEAPFRNVVPWEQFAEQMVNGIDIHFSAGIERSTLHRASVFLTAIVGELESDFQDTLRIPSGEVSFYNESGEICATPPDLAHGLHITFPQRWLRRQLSEGPSRFSSGATIEITVRGAFLRDRCGRMLDARPIGHPPEFSRDSMVGDDFVVAFCVQPKPRPSPKQVEQDESAKQAPAF